MYNSVVFGLFTKWCNHDHCLILEHFHHPQKKPHTPHFPQPAQPWTSTSLLLIHVQYLWIYLFWTFCINGVIQYVVLCDWFILLYIMFKRFIHVTVYVSVSFYCQIIFHGIGIPCFIYLVTNWWSFVVFTFWLLWMLLLWIFVYRFLYGHMFWFFLGIYLRVEFLDDTVTLFHLSFKELPDCFQSGCTILFSQQQYIWRFWFLHIFPNTCYYLSFWTWAF